MHGELFDSTLPVGEPELLKASTYQRYLDTLKTGLGSRSAGSLTPEAEFSPSLLADLPRCEQPGGGYEVVEVVAACVRHSTRLTIHLQCSEWVLPLTIFPRERLAHCPIGLNELAERHLSMARVMHLEPAVLRPPGDPLHGLIGDRHLYHLLAPLLWELALRGPRPGLLPEIAGPAVYRVAPSLELDELAVTGVLKAAIARLRLQSIPLNGIAAWPAFDRERASRLLNALYLQAGLIVSRSHPDASGERWFGPLGR